MQELLSQEILDLRSSAEQVAEQILPKAEEVDRHAMWPKHSFDALRDANLLGLQAPKNVGGHGQGLPALAVVTEQLGRACSSSALCFGMHCVGTAVIAAKATAYQEERYLKPIAQGRHITTLALSESGSGAHFYLPQTKLMRDGDFLRADGTKQFVTNGNQADSYVLSTMASEGAEAAGEFSCLVVDRGTDGMTWLDPWDGLGMRGNSSRGVRLDNVRVPKGNLLGEEGDQVWYVFEVVAPYFLMAMAGSYLGVAQSALDVATE